MYLENNDPLDKHLEKFCLLDTSKMGGVIWKCDSELSLAVIVGQDHLGNKYVVKNQPQKRNYRLTALDNFVTSYCFFETDNPVYDYDQMAVLAFQMLYNFNDFNQKTYDADFKLVVPQASSIIEKEPLNYQRFKSMMEYGVFAPVKQVMLNIYGSVRNLFEHVKKSMFPELPQALPPAKEQPLLGQPNYKILDMNGKRKIA